MSKVGDFMNRVNLVFSKGVTVIFSGVLFILFMIFVLPYMAEQLHDATSTSSSPDTFVSFNKNAFYEMIEAYGSNGRRVYIIQRWTFDVIWPLVYGSFLFSAVCYLTNKNNISRKYFILLPVLAVLFDVIENIFASIIMGVYPKQFDLLFYLLRAASTIKWALIAIAFLVVIVLFVKRIISLFR